MRNTNKNSKKFTSERSVTTYMLERLQQIKKQNILKEAEFSYPDMENDINNDIEDFKKNLPNYIIKIDPKTGYKIYEDNVIVYGTATIKSITFGFSFALSDDGCIIYYPKDGSNSMPLYDEIIHFFSDLKNYYTSVWRKNWIEKINNIGEG